MILGAVNGDAPRIALMWVVQAQFAGYVLARREVPNLELLPWRAGSTAIDLVSEDRADFAVASPAQLFGAGPRGDGLVFVGLFMQRSPIVLAGLRSRSGDRLRDVEGQRVGVWDGEDLEVRAMLHANAADLSRIEFVSMGEAVTPLLDGGVQFLQATTYEEVPALIRAGADPEDLVLHRPVTWGVDVAKDGLVVRQDVLDQQPELVDSVVRAVLRGWKDALSNPDKAVEAVCQVDPSLDPDWQLKQLHRIADLFDEAAPFGYPDPGEVARAARVHQLLGNRVETSQISIDAGPWRRATGG